MSIAAVSWGLGLGSWVSTINYGKTKWQQNQPRGLHMCIIPDKLMFIVYLLDE
jgi:hypothetical protein